MNNIQKKNKIYSLSRKSDLPNKSTSDVTVKSNQIIYTSINNNMEKLIDNDLFIEKHLQNAQQYQIGPKKYNKLNLDQQPNGYKMWNQNLNENVEISIYHKIDDELYEMIQPTEVNSGVNFIINNGNERMVGTESGLYRLRGGTIWTPYMSDKLSAGNIISYSYDNDSQIYLFTTTDGIYYSDKITPDTDLSVQKKSDIGNISSIYMIDGVVYVEKDRNISSVQNIHASSWTFEQHKTSINNLLSGKLVSVNKANNELLLTTEDSIYEMENQYSFDTLRNISFSEKTIRFLVKFKNKLYVICDKGIFTVEGDYSYNFNDSNQVINYCIYDDVLYILRSNGIYKYDGTNMVDDIVTEQTIDNNQSLGIFKHETGDFFILTGNRKIYWSSTTDNKNIDDWDEIDIPTDDNPSQIYIRDDMFISGKTNNESDSDDYYLMQIDAKENYIEVLTTFKNFGLNKIIYNNGDKYFLTKKGLYRNSLDSNQLINGNITDMSIDDGRWCAIINGHLYWGLDVESMDDDIHNTESVTYKCCSILNGGIYVLDNSNCVQYDMDFNFKNGTPPSLTQYDGVEKVGNIEAFNNKLYIYSTDQGRLSSLYTIPTISTENNLLSSDSTDNAILDGFNHSCNSIGQKKTVIFDKNSEEIFSYIYNNENLRKIGDNTQNNSSLSCISEYYYYRWTDDFTYQEILNENKNRYEVLSCAEEFTKDILHLYQDNKLCICEILSVDGDNFELSCLSSFEKEGILDIIQTYDLKDKEESTSGEWGVELSSNITFLFYRDKIEYDYFEFDRDNIEWWHDDDGGPYEVENYNNTGMSALISVGGYQVANLEINTIDTIEKLKNLKLSRNIENLMDENIFIFVNLSNDILYYKQNKDRKILEDFTDDNIHNISTVSETITDMAAVCVENKVLIYLKSDNDTIYSTEIDISDFWEKDISAVWETNHTSGGINKLTTFNSDIICTSTEKMSYKTFTHGTEIQCSLDDYDYEGVNGIKLDIEKDQLYVFHNEKIGVIKKSDRYPTRNISGIKNISYDSEMYYFIGETGVSVSQNVTISVPNSNSDISSIPFLEQKTLTDVTKNIYGTVSSIEHIVESSYYEPCLVDTISSEEYHLNFRQDSDDILFNNQNGDLKKLNGDFSSSYVYGITHDKNTVKLKVKTDNLFTDTHNNIYDASNGMKIHTGNIINELCCEYDGYIWDGTSKNLQHFTKIGLYEYYIEKYDFGDVFETEKVFQFDDEKLMLVSSCDLYYYLPDTNTYYLKYTTQDTTQEQIGQIKKTSDGFMITEGNNIFHISERFNGRSKNFILSVDNITDFDNQSKYDYLLGTTVGLFETIYSYEIENDIPLCSANDIKEFSVQQFNRGLDDHIKTHHNQYSTITRINDQLMPVDCSNLDGVEENTDIVDYIRTIEFSGSAQYISAYVSFDNELSVNDTMISGLSFIAKNYSKNNMCELYIYIPSTGTNYINHVNEIKNDESLTQNIYRKNTNMTTSRYVNPNKTNIDLLIDKYHFDINRIVAVDINGNSLPLKIYKDTDNTHLFNFNGFSQVVKKSMYKRMEYDERNDIIRMNFMCFGTDAQAIRLETVLNVRYIIRYHFRNEIIEQHCVVDIEYDVPYNSEIENGKVFSGWTKNEGSTSAQYPYGTKFKNITKVKNDTVDLYPVYRQYIFDTSNSTIFTLKPSGRALYFDGEIINDNQVVVDYDAVIEPIIVVRPTENMNKTVTISEVNVSEGDQVIIDWDYKYDY